MITNKRYLTDDECFEAFCVFHNLLRPNAKPLTVEDIRNANKKEQEQKQNNKKGVLRNE